MAEWLSVDGGYQTAEGGWRANHWEFTFRRITVPWGFCYGMKVSAWLAHAYPLPWKSSV